MFDKFGEFDSYEEINMAAEGFFNEGDFESLSEMAKENGIPEEYVQMYREGDIPFLCDALAAALGKIDIESEQLKPVEIMADWVEYLKGQCMEHEEIALAVRKKGKTLKGCIAELLKWSFNNMYSVHKEIQQAAGADELAKKLGPSGAKRYEMRIGIPGMGRAKKIIREYYLGGTGKC